MIVWIAHAKVGHRQTPYKQQSPPREGFVVFVLRKPQEMLVRRTEQVYHSPEAIMALCVLSPNNPILRGAT